MTVTPFPTMEHTFTVSIKGSRTKRIYDGTFTFRLPDLKTESNIDKLRVRLNEGMILSEEIDFLHEMVSFLSFTLVESPEWWKTKAVKLELHDMNVYTELYEECIKFQKQWHEKVWTDDQEQAKS